MSKEAMDQLRREERLIKVWIRDITARKQGRLREIRAKLRALSREIRQNGKCQNCAQVTIEQSVAPETEE